MEKKAVKVEPDLLSMPVYNRGKYDVHTLHKLRRYHSKAIWFWDDISLAYGVRASRVSLIIY